MHIKDPVWEKIFLNSIDEPTFPNIYRYDLSLLVGRSLPSVILSDRVVSLGFRRYGDTKPFIRHLNPIEKAVPTIIKKIMNVDYKIFDDFLKDVIYTKLKTITLNDAFEHCYSVFQLKKDYASFSDIEYYELCYATNWTASGQSYFLFRFYVDPVEPSCVLEGKVSEFPYHIDNVEAFRSKAIISTHYKNLDPVILLFLNNYKREFSKIFGYQVDHVNQEMADVISMMII